MSYNESFEEIYNNLSKMNFHSLEHLREKAKNSNKTIKAFTGIMVIPLIFFPFGLIYIFVQCMMQGADVVFSSEANQTIKYVLIALAICIGVLILRYIHVRISKNKDKKYRNKYIQDLTTSFIKQIDSNYSFDYKKGILEKSYKEIQLMPYEEYESHGLISGKLDSEYSFKAGQVTMWDIRERNETKEKVITFDGIMYEVDLPFTIKSKLYIRNDRSVDNAGTIRRMLSPDGYLSNKKVKLDSEEFERVFDVYADDKIVAMQILTADIMMELLNIYSTSLNKFLITIENNKMYIRFNTGAIFKAPENINTNVLDRETLLQYYKQFENTLKATEKLSKLIEKNIFV